MTSTERHEARYQRRKQQRLINKASRCAAIGTLADVYTYRDMFYYGRLCCKGVRWKQSTQNFEMHLFSGTAARRKAVLNGKWRPKPCKRFRLCERGKSRIIDAPHIVDRQIHKVLTNKVLTPLYTPCMIYDNGASQKGKGLHWYYKRVKQHLAWHYRHYGRQGGVFLLDLKGYFPNANRQLIYAQHKRLFLNPETRAFADKIVDSVPDGNGVGIGMPLGIEPSQQEMIAMTNKIDNYLKCQLGLKCVGHYMDDYYIIYPDMDKLQDLAEIIIQRFEALGIPVNRKKCHIIPLTKPFRVCKVKFTLTDSGRIVTNGNRDSIRRARRKLKLFHRELLEGKRSPFEVSQLMQCQRAYYRNYNDHGRLLRLERLYYALFHNFLPV